ncbi:MAG: hypothetical protein KY475_11640 [Planctomycetes bacterium]|nr:hypothetical protein [Planctomycetota bacterium]
MGGDRAAASSKVAGPAIALIVIGVLNVLLALLGVVNNIRTMGADPAEIEAQFQPGQLEDLEQQGFDPQAFVKFAQAGGAIGVVLNIIALIVGIVIIMGALKMKNLQSRGLAMTAAILAMIPFISPACCPCIIGLPIGIWALVAMNDPNVKTSFTS